MWLGYSAFVVAARLFADPVIPFDDRIAAPAIVCLTIAFGVLLALWWRLKARGARLVAGLALAAWIMLALRLDIRRVGYALVHGTLYTQPAHASSPVMQWTRRADAPDAIFTNAPATLYFNAGRLSTDLPLTWDSTSLRAFRDTLAARHGVVITFDYPSGKVAATKAFVRDMRLAPLQRFADATIWIDTVRSGSERPDGQDAHVGMQRP
jgi:hypothetical protein